jgi:PAS domain S-box-containing protein
MEKQKLDNRSSKKPLLFSSLRKKLTVSFSFLFLAILIALILTGLFGMPFIPFAGSWGQQRAEAFKSLNLVADLKKERLLRWLEERRDDSRVLAESNLVKTGVFRLRSIIHENIASGRGNDTLSADMLKNKLYQDMMQHITLVKNTYGEYVMIEIADVSTGYVLACTDKTKLGKRISQVEHLRERLNSDEVALYFEKDINTGSFDLNISVPVKYSDKVIAALIMHIDLNGFVNPLLHTGEGLGETGEALLVDEDARIITPLKHPLQDGREAEPMEYVIKAKPAVFSARGEEGIIETEDYRGVAVLAAFRYIPVSHVKGWGMVVKRDRSELFAPLVLWTYYHLLTGLIGVIVVVGLTRFLAGKVTGPLRSLSGVAEKVAEGDLSCRSEVTTGDEVGALAETFNSMVDRVQNWREELREKVHIRTEELNLANEELISEVSVRRKAENELRKALDELQQRSAETAALFEGSQAVLKFEDFKEAARSIFNSCKNLIGATAGYVALLSEDGSENEVLFLDSGGLQCSVNPDLPMPIRGLRAEAYKTGKTVYENRFNDSNWVKFMPDGHVTLENVLFAPLIIERKSIGLLGIANKQGGFTENDARMASAFCELAAIALYNSRLLESLNRSEEKNRRLFESANDSIFLIDLETRRLIDINDNAAERLGYTREEMLGLTINDIDAPMAADRNDDIIRELREKESVVFEHAHRHKDGTVIPVEISSRIFDFGDQKIIQSFVRDITERKRYESVLKEKQIFIQSIADTIPNILYIFDIVERNFVYANQMLNILLGYVTEEILQMGESAYRELIHPDDLPKWRAHLNYLLTLRDGDIISIEFRLKSVDGAWLWINNRNVVFSRTDSGLPKLILGTAQDITEQKKSEEELERHQHKLEDIVNERTAELIRTNEEIENEIAERRSVERALRLNEARLEVLVELNQMYGESIDSIADFALEEAIRLTMSTFGYFGCLNEDETVFTVRAWSKTVMKECRIVDKPLQFQLETSGLWGEPVRKRKPVIINDYPSSSLHWKGLPYGHVPVFRFMSVPIFDGKRIVAIAAVANKQGEYDESDVRQLTLLMEGMWQIVQRKRAEEALRESEEKYRDLYDNAPDMYHSLDENGIIIDCNETEARMLGYSKQYIIGTHITEFFTEKSNRLFEVGFERLKKEKFLFNEEREFMKRDGTIFTANLNIFADFDENGNLIRTRTIARDISESKLAEERLITSEHRYRMLSQEFNALLDAMSDSIMLLSPDFQILWANKGASLILDKSSDEMKGQYCYTLWYDRDYPCEKCPAAKCLRTCEAETMFVGTNRGKAFDIRAFPIKDESEEVSNILVVTSDVTETINLQAEAMRASHLASLGELAAGVAHEINNPINGIINYAQILIDRKESGHSMDIISNDLARQIIHESERIASIVRSLLSFSKDAKDEKSYTRIEDIVSDTLALTGAQLRKDGIRLKKNIPRKLPEVAVHYQQIEQVFLNIVNNARFALNQKYPENHKNKLLEITVNEITVDEDQFVRISFTDSGIGIPSENLDKVMNPFFTTKHSSKGTGLGLSISHGIVGSHGGRIFVESTEGKFTRLIVELPVGNRVAK